MKIANPIYDAVFKYMMEDADVSKLFLSAIIKKEVIEISFLPQELSGDKITKNQKISIGLSIYRLDFSAKIRANDGTEQLIIIEVQKVKMYNDIMRFRRYLGKQYMNESYGIDAIDSDGKKIKKGIPIYSIYFFGETLPGFENHPIVNIKLKKEDNQTKEELAGSWDLINSLYHEGTIVTIPALKRRRRNELEKLLSIFDQENITKDMHIMSVEEAKIPVKFKPIIRRLQKAVQVKKVRDVMDIEDDFVKELQEYESRAIQSEHRLDQERNLRLKAQKEKAMVQKEKEEERKLKEEALIQKEEAILLLLANGVSKQVISNQLALPMAYINRIIKKQH